MVSRIKAYKGPVIVMAIGTSVSSPMHEQSSYPDYYFEATYKL
jgi:hypothetical protein